MNTIFYKQHQQKKKCLIKCFRNFSQTVHTCKKTKAVIEKIVFALQIFYLFLNLLQINQLNQNEISHHKKDLTSETPDVSSCR